MTVRHQTAPRPMHPGWALIAWIGVCLAAGALGSWFTFDAVRTWYPTLQKPAWNPPSWVFGPVWTTLYVLMGTAAWRVWRRSAEVNVRPALRLFGVQLLLNAVWSGLFFGLHAPGWALLELVLLWAAILATLLHFRPLERPAAWLLTPYLAWVSFAGFLNFTIWRLNGQETMGGAKPSGEPLGLAPPHPNRDCEGANETSPPPLGAWGERTRVR